MNRLPGALPLLLLCCSLLSSCIAEDLSDCAQLRLRVVFAFEADTGTAATRQDGTHQVTLYAFNKNGVCEMAREFEITDLNSRTELDVNLEAGTYDFVAWINHDKEYFDLPVFEQYPQVKPQKDVATLYLDIPDNGIVDYELPRLLHGSASAQTLDAAGNAEVTIPLTQNTNYITFTAEGLDRTADTYEFEVSDYNGAYTFGNEFDACTPFRYIASALFTGGQDKLEAEMTILKLAPERTPDFIFRNRTTGKTLYPSDPEQETNLVRLIEKAYRNEGKKIDFDRQHRFDIKLKFDANFNATVSVNGWDVVEDDSGLKP